MSAAAARSRLAGITLEKECLVGRIGFAGGGAPFVIEDAAGVVAQLVVGLGWYFGEAGSPRRRHDELTASGMSHIDGPAKRGLSAY